MVISGAWLKIISFKTFCEPWCCSNYGSMLKPLYDSAALARWKDCSLKFKFYRYDSQRQRI